MNTMIGKVEFPNDQASNHKEIKSLYVCQVMVEEVIVGVWSQ